MYFMKEVMVMYDNEVKKECKNSSHGQAFPVIRREDVMSSILSEYVTKNQKVMLSAMYFEIVQMERKTLEYITEIAISSRQDAEIYDIITFLKRKEKENKKSAI